MPTHKARGKKVTGQVWFSDFVIGSLIFFFALTVYFAYSDNFVQQDALPKERLLAEAESMSSALLLKGYPNSWDETDVVAVGITNNDHVINASKLLSFKALSYQQSKPFLGTVHDYFIYFTDANDTILNIEGVCGIGHPLINSSYSIKAAYFYDNVGDMFLLDFMNKTLGADIYSSFDAVNDLDAFIANINDYGFAVMEHPDMSGSEFDNADDSLNAFVSNGSFLMLSGQIATAQGSEMLGTKFYKKSGQATTDRNATVVKEDTFTSFTLGESIVFRQAYYVENQSTAVNVSLIATFNADGNNALARWYYGNGSAMFFSDFDTSYFNGNFVSSVQQTVSNWGKFKCLPLDISAISYTNLVKIERFLLHDNEPIKMVVLAWQ